MFGTRLFQCSYLFFRQAYQPGPHQSAVLHNQKRRYVYRAINHQRLLASWNGLRIWIRNPMFPFHLAGFGMFGFMFYLYHREHAPLTGRSRFNMVSPHWEQQLGYTYFQREMRKNDEKILPQSSEEHARVQRVLYRLTTHRHVPDEIWEAHVIDDPEIAACSLPGGKVFINRGMLDLCERDDELAVILGHEIAHGLVRHSSERLSRWLLLMPFVVVGSLASGMDEDLVQLAIDVAFQLPHERAHEVEADQVGLLIMAESGYDPSAALDLWARWELRDQNYIPRFLRTHPSHHDRLTQFYQWHTAGQRKRLLSDCTAEEFHEAYCLQRTFCGLERDFDAKASTTTATTTITHKALDQFRSADTARFFGSQFAAAVT